MKQAKTLKPDELNLVLAYIAVRRHAARNRTIVLASFLSGMRAHELASLKIGDVIDEGGRIRNEIVLSAAQTKGRRARRVFVNAKLKRELGAYVKSDCANKPLSSPLFVSQKGRAFSPNTMCQLFLNMYKGCGIKGASSHNVVLTVRFGAKPIEFEKGKAAIAVGKKESLISTIETVIQAVEAGELDAVLRQMSKTAVQTKGRKAA